MAGRFQLRRGNTAQNDAFTGAEGEITYDTQAKGIRVHDGVTPGGNALFGVVEFQHPTSANNYTWYRKYSDGWLEQGGICSISQDTRTTVNMPKAFSDTNYQVTITAVADLRTGGDGNFTVNRQTASQFYWCNGDDFSGQGVWCARGMAA